MDTLQGRAVTASQTLNDLTGYSAIEAIKRANVLLETELTAAQTRLRAARETYKTLNSSRASTQLEVTTLLARKDTWSPADLERFTTLYRADHEQEARIASATTELSDAEAEEDRLSAALNSGILKRYHEEQIWSDRIRRQSTWGTWGLMGVNILLFLVFQFVAEPWKRHRLMKGIAAEEKGALEEVRRELEEVKVVLAARTDSAQSIPDHAFDEPTASPGGVAAESVEETSNLSAKELLLDPRSWPSALTELLSDRRIDLRMRDAALLAVEGAITGAAAAAIALTLLRRA
jgi:sensitive to high expression protein 9, mitochondrial